MTDTENEENGIIPIAKTLREHRERAHCLQMACDLVAARQGYAADVIDSASRFYAFMNGDSGPSDIPAGTTAADLGANAEPPPSPPPAPPADDDILF